MDTNFPSNKYILFSSITSLILFLIDIVYVINSPTNTFDDLDIIKIFNIIRVLLTFIELLTSIVILIYRYKIKNIFNNLIYLKLEKYFNDIGFIFSLIILILQWGINLYNTFISILLMKAENNKKEKYISFFQIIWILVLGNIACITWVIITVNWFYMKNYEEKQLANKYKLKKHDTITGKNVSFLIEKMKNNENKYLICEHNSLNEEVVNLKNSSFIICQSLNN